MTPQISPAICISLIRKHNPMLEEGDIVQNTDGLNCFVFIVKQQIVFRFPNSDSATASLRREIQFLTAFSPLSPVKIPHLEVHHDPSGLIYCTYPYIPGDPFRDDWAKTFIPDKKQVIARQLGAFLSVLHGFPVEKAKELGLPERNIISETLATVEKTRTEIFPKLTPQEQQWIADLYTNFSSLLQEHPITLTVCHYDFMPKHLLIDRKSQELQGIIDFGYVSIGDPANDFTFLDIYGVDFLKEVYKTYIHPHDEYFEKRRVFYNTRHMLTDMRAAIITSDNQRFMQAKEKLIAQMQPPLQ